MQESNQGQTDELTSALEGWRQGDCVIGENWFFHKFDPDLPITQAAKNATEQAEIIETAVEGFVLLTQTCDIIRDYNERPFVELAPLIKSEDENEYLRIERRLHPQFAPIPYLKDLGLVADLDRCMTIEKSLLLKWKKYPQSMSVEEGKRFSEDLARKSQRFAFPDNFVDAMQKLQNRLKKKHDVGSSEGETLRAIREIRVRAAPSWEESEVELDFFFVLQKTVPPAIHSQIDQWLDLFEVKPPFKKPLSHAVTLSQMSALEYVQSDILDLSYLSSRSLKN